MLRLTFIIIAIIALCYVLEVETVVHFVDNTLVPLTKQAVDSWAMLRERHPYIYMIIIPASLIFVLQTKGLD